MGSSQSKLQRVRRYGDRLRRHRGGTPAGSLDVIAEGIADDTVQPPARIHMLRYGDGPAEEARDVNAAAITAPPSAFSGVVWIAMEGLPTPEQLATLGKALTLEPLALEDVINRAERPKCDVYEGGPFVILEHFRRTDEGALVESQISLFLGRGWVLSIHEGEGDIFAPIAQRIRANGTKRPHDASFLFYSLIDLAIDACFPVLDEFGERLEVLEDRVMDDPGTEARNEIHFLRRELRQLRRSWWPQRDTLAALMRDGDDFLSEETQRYLRDCHDHCVIVVDFVETYRETASGLMDLYLSSISQRMNDIMKALTVFASIFMPLGFIASLYGMNFDPASPWNMPELHWRFGYLYVLGLMLGVVMAMILWFRHKRWF